jgi:hypothetical protein
LCFILCTACSAFECGAPFALCGEDVPKDAKCPKGNGWCQAGHYCASNKTRQDKGQSKCLPVPKDCGKAGNACCPSNTDTPHTASTSGRRPFCRDGSTCFFHWRDDELFNTPAYAGVTGRHFRQNPAVIAVLHESVWTCCLVWAPSHSKSQQIRAVHHTIMTVDKHSNTCIP